MIPNTRVALSRADGVGQL